MNGMKPLSFGPGCRGNLTGQIKRLVTTKMKLNYNSARFNDGSRVTLRFADLIEEKLTRRHTATSFQGMHLTPGISRSVVQPPRHAMRAILCSVVVAVDTRRHADDLVQIRLG